MKRTVDLEHPTDLPRSKVLVDPIVAKEMATQSLHKYCEDWNDSKSFEHAVALALEVFTARELADKFEAAPVTIQRWANGTANPHPGVKKYVVSTLQKI